MASLLAVLVYDPETSFEVLNIIINTDYSCNDIHNKLVVIKHHNTAHSHTNPQENTDNSGYK